MAPNSSSTPPLEELDVALMLFCRIQSIKCAQIPPLARLWVFLAGIKAIAAGFEFSEHIARLNQSVLREEIISLRSVEASSSS